MNDIDVEPVDDVDEGEGEEIEAAAADADLPGAVEAPEYVLYGGKGGVGKTTMAAATALASAAEGTATLVVSTDPAHSLSDTLQAEIPPEPTQLRDDVPLYAAEIDPDAIDEGLFGAEGEPLGGLGEIGEHLGGAGPGGPGATDGPGGLGGLGPFGPDDEGAADGNGAGDAEGAGIPGLGGPMPGADEAAAMRQLLEYLDDPRFDRVVVDTAPTGHTLRLLELPEIMESMVGRLLGFRDRLSGMIDGLTGMFGGGDDEADTGAAGADLDELRDRIERLRDVLRDPDRTDFRVVLVPEEMSVVESERLVERLDAFGIPVRTIVVNRVMEELAAVADVDSEWVVSPDLEGCEFCQRRWDVQQRALQRATDLFRNRRVERVPLLADEVRGEEALRVVAACLD